MGNALSEKNFFLEAKKNYEEKKYDESKFLFQRNIVFNPKDENSYLYLAKIYNLEKNERAEEKRLVERRKQALDLYKKFALLKNRTFGAPPLSTEIVWPKVASQAGIRGF